jgi:hypothetical protein
MKSGEEALILKPTNWPRWLRRMFILTLPISVIVWTVLICLLVLVACLFLAFVQVSPWFAAMWRGEPRHDEAERTGGKP